MSFIRISPSENSFYIISKHNGDIRFSAFDKHEFELKVYCEFDGLWGVIQESKIAITYEGGHRVELDIKNDHDNPSSKKRTFSYEHEDFSN